MDRSAARSWWCPAGELSYLDHRASQSWREHGNKSLADLFILFDKIIDLPVFFFHLYWVIVDKSRSYAWKPFYILTWLPAEDSGSQQKTLALSSQISHLQNMQSQACVLRGTGCPSFSPSFLRPILWQGLTVQSSLTNIPVLIPSRPCFIRINFPKTTFFSLP